jgi:Flp pilus assembly protein TadG
MKTLIRRLSRNRLRARQRDAGQGQIEFVLSILTIMFVIFWTWEVVLAVYTYNVLSDAAKEGVRYAIVHGSNNQCCSGPGTCAVGTPSLTLCDGAAATCPDSSGDNVARTVKCYASLSLHDTTNMTVSVTYPQGTNTAGSEVDIRVNYTYVPFLALPIAPPLKTASSGRIVN